MIRFLRWAWRFDLLWWLAKRHGYQYEYCYLFWPWWATFIPFDAPKSKSSSIHFNPNAIDMHARRNKPVTNDDDDGLPADMWRAYGPAEPETH